MNKQVTLKLPIFGFVLVTRAALAGGVGLLVSRKLSDAQRRAVGMALVAIGAVTTFPAILSVIRGVDRRRFSRNERPPDVRRDERLTGSTRFPRSADDEFVSA